MKIPLYSCGFCAAAFRWMMAYSAMFPAPLPDLDGLDPEALKALLIAKHNESLGTAQAAEFELARDRASEAGHREVSADDLRPEEREAHQRTRTVGASS